MLTPQKLRALFPIHHGFDVMDCFGPMEMLSLATHLNPDKSVSSDRAIETIVAAEQPLTESFAGVKIAAQMTMKEAYENLGTFDILVVPGGNSFEILGNGYKEPMEIIKAFASLPSRPRERIIMSVCTGSLFLATAGILERQVVTTNISDLDRLRRMVAGSSTTVAKDGERFVVNANGGVKGTGLPNYRIMTSAGPGAGLELALWLVEYLVGVEVRESIEILSEYRSQPRASLILD